MAAQAALSKRGVAVLILPVDISKAKVADEREFDIQTDCSCLRLTQSGQLVNFL
jgi:pyruvate dehydrogenase (quinone)